MIDAQERSILDARREWQERRSAHVGLGASDAPAALGFDPYKSPLKLWMELTGREEREVGGEAAEWGSITESTLLRETAIRRQAIVLGNNEWLEPCLWAPSGRMIPQGSGQYEELMGELGEWTEALMNLRHSRHHWLVAHPDGYIMAKREGNHLLHPIAMLQVKTTSEWLRKNWGEESTDEVPERVIVQTAVERALYGGDPIPTIVVALVGGNKYSTYTLAPDEKLEQGIIEKLVAFKALVDSDTPPEPQDEQDWKEALNALFPPPSAGELIATAETTELAKKIKVAYDRAKQAEKELEEYRNQMKEIMGDKRAVVGDGWKVLWYDVENAHPNWKAIAAELAGGEVPSEIVERNRAKPYRVFRAYTDKLEVE